MPAFCHPRQAQLIPYWEKVYGLEVEAVDVGEAFVRLLRNARPRFRQSHEPCVDCKILMMRKARELMKNGSVILSPVALGQRPMSQRRDTSMSSAATRRL